MWKRIRIISACVFCAVIIMAVPVSCALGQERMFSEAGAITNTDTGFSVDAEFTLLEKDQRAPFEGFLLSPASMSKILADAEFTARRLSLEYQYNLSVLKAQHEADSKALQITIDSQKSLYEERLHIQEKETDRLHQIVKDSSSGYAWAWWGASGFLSGTALTVGIVYLVK